jgi:plastocyanin
MTRGSLPLILSFALGGVHAGPLQVTVTDAAGKPLADAAVFLESPAAKAQVRPLPGVELGQQNKQFEQRVLLVTAGTAVAFPNRDTVRHHVYSFSPTKPFELKLYIGTPANPVLFDRAGIAVLGCNIHDQMAAWVVVVETPYHALTGATGTARLSDVPPGNYRLRTWHPNLPPGAAALDQALTVAPAGGAVTVKLAS